MRARISISGLNIGCRVMSLTRSPSMKPPDRRGWSLYTGHPFVSRVSPVLEALVAPSYGCFEPLLASDLAEFLTLRRLCHRSEAEHLLTIVNVAHETAHIIG